MQKTPDIDPMESTKQRWLKIAAKHLVGRKIVAVRWMTPAETDQLEWHHSAVLLVLDNGTLFWPSADDEGNDAGALFGLGTYDEPITLPVI